MLVAYYPDERVTHPCDFRLPPIEPLSFDYLSLTTHPLIRNAEYLRKGYFITVKKYVQDGKLALVCGGGAELSSLPI